MQISKYRNELIAGAVLALAVGTVIAGSTGGGGGAEFNNVWDTLVDWPQGTLGRIIAIAMVLVGLVAGVVRQSIMGLVIGIAAGMGLYNAPTVIQAIMGASIEAATPEQVAVFAQMAGLF